MDISIRFLTCLPNIDHKPNYKDEADKFFENPESWLSAHLPLYYKSLSKNPIAVVDPLPRMPSHVVMFDNLKPSFINAYKYEECAKSFHSHFPESHRSKYLLVYCLPLYSSQRLKL